MQEIQYFIAFLSLMPRDQDITGLLAADVVLQRLQWC
jgi:hypothetical protein